MVTTTARAASEDRSLAIVKAAYRVMSRRGVHRVPLADVAEEAGVSKGLVLYHYGSKDGLVLAALEWVLIATEARLHSAREGSTRTDEALQAVVAAIWRDPQANRDFFRFYLDGVEHQTRVDGFDRFGKTATRIIEGFYAEVLTAAMEAGAIPRADPDHAAATMRAVIEGFFLQWLQRSDWKSSHAAYRRRCSDAVLTALTAVA